ncbi:MAG: hypothetical protein KME35_17540 [Aphanocapsa sp. GSE-SYN-MK-11-07L]|jgi:type II secretory pathway pseudopilin PulG|nr:hypothetical protein [Aphanocapsa sp. GSE-SYN-MK-11-07L]
MKRRLKGLQKSGQRDQGFTLVVAMAIGVIMLLLTTTLITKAQQDQAISTTRSRTSNSLAVAEGGMARALTELIKAHNSVLLTRNYDPLNPSTSKTYFGPDGILNNGDEEGTAVNEWENIPASSNCGTGVTPPSITYTGAIGANGQYTLKAYRYNANNQTGTFLVEGKEKTGTSYLVVTTAISSVNQNFPGVVSAEKLELLGRKISGSNGNVYYDPALSEAPGLTGSAAPGEPARGAYLNAIKTGSNDGFTTDNVSGKIIACKLALTLPASPQGTNLGSLDNTRTVLSTGGITNYRTDKIELKNNNIVDFDTTNGPIHLYVNGSAQILDQAKIRNIRTDGKPPKVGDLRIIMSASQPFKVQDQACVQTAFVYSRRDKLELAGKADGCGGSSNINGVVWMKEISTTSGDFSAIAVPEDVSSLADVLKSLNLMNRSKLSGVLKWQRVKL